MVLSITGVEALYADMGHFGKFTYSSGLVFGGIAFAGAELLWPGRCCSNTRKQLKPVLLLAPEWALIPMLIIAALATVIASRRLSPASSPDRQAVRLGYLSPMRIIHTSEMESGRFTSRSSTGCCISRWLS